MMITRSIVIICCLTILVGCQTRPDSQKNTEVVQAAIEEKPQAKPVNRPLKSLASDTPYPFDITLKRADGSTTSSKDVLNYSDGPTIVAFWLTTCGPCRIELAAIKQKFAGWQEEADFKFVAISTDFPKNYPAFVKMVDNSNWPWEAYNDVDRQFWRVMPGALNGLPQVFVYDTNGEIVYHKRKYKTGDEDILFNKIKELQ